MNMYLIILEGHYGAIDSDDYRYNGYYIIRFSSCLYTLQADLSIDGQVISSGQMICEGNYFSVNINDHCYVLQKNKPITFFSSIMTIINGNVNVICYDLKDIVLPSLQYMSQNYYNTLSPLNIPMVEHDNIMYEKPEDKALNLRDQYQ